MIKRATKRPVTIEYVEWTGENIEEVLEFVDDGGSWLDVDGDLILGAQEGTHLMDVGDLIIKGEDEAISRSTPEIFAKTYNIESE